MFGRIISLVIKELLTMWRDPKSRIILIVPPTVQMLVLAFAATQDVKNISIAILNQDVGTSSRDLVALYWVAAVYAYHVSDERAGDRTGDRFS